MPETHRRPRVLTMLGQLYPGDGLTAYCGCGRIVPLNIRKLQRRFPPRSDFARVAASLVCLGTKDKPGCKRHSPSLLCMYDDRVSWAFIGDTDSAKAAS